MGIAKDKTLLRALGRRIRTARKRRNLTQEALADRSGLQRRFVIQLEMGEGNPTYLTLHNLAKALRVSPEDLI